MLLAGITAAFLAGCTPLVDARGHGTDPDDFKQVIVGQSRAEDVQALLGSPSVRSEYGEEVWYYITEKRETVGPYAPEVTEQHVTAIHFDAGHVVTVIDDHPKQDGQAVTFVDKETPVEGTHEGVVQQMIGNIGRFGAPGKTIDPRDISH